MKKTLIALAAVAVSGAAFAQATISGNLDFAYGTVKAGDQAKETTVSTRDLTSSTSVIRITAVEDLGGGMRATAHFGLDPRLLANNGTAMGRDELFVGVSGAFGNIRLGSPNSIGLTTFLAGSPLGTGIGSGYGVTALDYSAIRYSRSVRYDSPAINGITVSALYAPGADATVSGAADVTGAATADVIGGVSRQVTELGLAYSAGPLAVSFANVSRAAQAANVKTSSNILSARYTLGATVISAGMNNGDSLASTTAKTKTKGSRVGVAHTMDAVTVMASYATQKSGVVTEKVTGLRADYALSKTAAVYAGYESYNTGVAESSAITGKRTTMSLGLRKSF
jgi:predicted porin